MINIIQFQRKDKNNMLIIIDDYEFGVLDIESSNLIINPLAYSILEEDLKKDDTFDYIIDMSKAILSIENRGELTIS